MDIFEISKSIFYIFLGNQPENFMIYSWDYLEEIGRFRFLSYVLNLLNYDFENYQSGILEKKWGLKFKKINNIF